VPGAGGRARGPGSGRWRGYRAGGRATVPGDGASFTWSTGAGTGSGHREQTTGPQCLESARGIRARKSPPAFQRGGVAEGGDNQSRPHADRITADRRPLSGSPRLGMANHPFPASPGIVSGPTNVPPCFLAILSRRIPSRFVTGCVTPNMYSLMFLSSCC
jgi:hypothetical protein